MELNDPITISNEYQFCEEGNRLALVFMKASRDSVAMLYTESVTDAQTRVDTTLSRCTGMLPTVQTATRIDSDAVSLLPSLLYCDFCSVREKLLPLV